MAAVESIRPLEVSPPGNSELKITNRGAGRLYFGQNQNVSSSNKLGELGPGESLTIKTKSVWLIAQKTTVIVDFEEKPASLSLSELPPSAVVNTEFLTRVATGESIFVSSIISAGNIVNQGKEGALRLPACIVPFPCRVAAVQLALFGGGLAVDATNFWEIYVQRYNQVAEGLQGITAKSTRLNVGEAFTQYQGWNFDREEFINAILGEGDSVLVKFESITGTSATLLGPIVATVRLEEI